MTHADSNSDDELIVGINVTPLVDVVLVLLVVLMVTATYLASRAIPVDLPRGATGEAVDSPLAISVDAEGRWFLDGRPIEEAALRRRVREARRRASDVRVVIAADGSSRHRSVVGVIDLLRSERVTHFAINVDPEDLKAGG
jgi:biopolymer transport protein ExbD